MSTLGIEICDAGFQAAVQAKGETRLTTLGDRPGVMECPGFAYHDGREYRFGRAAEEAWFQHPRQVCHSFWDKLSHEASPLNVGGRAPSFSELAFFFLRDYVHQLGAAAGSAAKVVLAVPGAYLKDAATEEQRVGLLLGMAGELRLPVAGIVDMACAALSDPRSSGFDPSRPVLVLDLHLHGADLTVFGVGERLARLDYLHQSQTGYVLLLKHLNAAMGNRFLRQTAFDILADGQIEQAFYRQTKDFLLGGVTEYRFQINTEKRTYEMIATRDQLATDAQPFVQGLVQAAQILGRKASATPDLCTVALTTRATAGLPGLEGRLRAAGFNRLLRLPVGAAAGGAAHLGVRCLPVVPLAEVPVATSVAIADARRAEGAPWEARLHKAQPPRPGLPPTHVIIEGVGHALAGHGELAIGTTAMGATLALPESFDLTQDCLVRLVRDDGGWWFAEPPRTAAEASPHTGAPVRTMIEAGDRLVFCSGALTTELLFACVQGATAPKP